MKYELHLQGGIGPDIWDKDVIISGADFMDCAQQSQWIADYENAIIESLTIIVE